MRRLRTDESGLALVVAVFITGLMLMSGLAIVAFADNQTTLTGKERLRENTLTLAEGVLNAQANLLSSGWPETPEKSLIPCTDDSTDVRCPDAATLLRGFQNKDFSGGLPTISWHLSVRDNGLGSFYDDAATQTQPAWDQSGPTGVPDGVMWLRSQATVRGETRTIVSLIRATPVGLAFPRGVITAGHFHTTNNGNKVLVDSGNDGPGILARCSAGPGGPARGNACLDYQVTKGQVYPNSYTDDPSIPNAMQTEEINSLRNRAKAAGKYYATCPPTFPSAELVFVESGPCSMGTGTVMNSRANPGLLVINKGTLLLDGSAQFYGLIYAANASTPPLTGTVVEVTGEAYVRGAIVVDNQGGLTIGGSALNVQYDANAFNLVTTTRSINVIANSWRELPG